MGAKAEAWLLLHSLDLVVGRPFAIPFNLLRQIEF
jgi:hypothetical protein